MAEKEVGFGTVYDMNKMLVLQNTPPMTEMEIAGATLNIVTKFLEDHPDSYYMVLCHERRDYTVYKNLDNKFTTIACDMIGLAKERGTIYSIGYNDSSESAVEVWIKPLGDEDIGMYVIFPYGQAVIEL